VSGGTTTPAVPSPHIPVRPDWLARRQEEILEPARPIVDPHHHLWDRPGNPYFLPHILADAASGHNIVATVFVECHAMYRADGPAEMRPVGEVEFANGIAAMSASGAYGPARIAAGIVGNVDLRIGARARAVLEAEIVAGCGRFRGIRNISAWHADPRVKGSVATPPPGLLGERGFRDGFAQLAPLGLSFDAWMYHTQLGELLELADAFPDTAIVMDHIGGALAIGPYAGRREDVFQAWHEAIRELARRPNVTMKLGGLGMRLAGFDFHEQPEPPSSQVLAAAWGPYFEACIAAFGPERCMFESNFPVDKGLCSYQALWNACKRVVRAYSEAEKDALFRGTASRVYRLDTAA